MWPFKPLTIEVNVNVNLTDVAGALGRIENRLAEIERKADDIMASEAEALQKLTNIETTLVKVSGESSALIQEIADLKILIQNQPVSQAIMDKIASIEGHANAIDALVPDPPTPPTE